MNCFHIVKFFLCIAQILQNGLRLLSFFSNIVKNPDVMSLQHQLELFHEDFAKLTQEYLKEQNSVKFWSQTDEEYSLIKKLALTLIILTCAVLRDVKTEKRNRL